MGAPAEAQVVGTQALDLTASLYPSAFDYPLWFQFHVAPRCCVLSILGFSEAVPTAKGWVKPLGPF